jgi:hypothetical protein
MNEENDPIIVPITDILDLHAVPPRDARPVLEAWLEEVHQRGFQAIRIIHGRGIGVQREMVRKVLAQTPFIQAYGDAPAEAGGWGATIATLGERDSDPMSSRETQLANVRTAIDAIRDDARQLSAGLNPAQWNWRSSPEKWSIGQCFEHLAILDRLYAESMAQVIALGRQQQQLGTGPFRYGWMERLFVRTLEPPPRLRMPAPALFRPKPEPRDVAMEPTLAAFFAQNAALRRLADEAEGLHLTRLRVASPVSSLWKFSLGIVFEVAAAHDRRHLYQVRGLKSLPGFPK